MSGRKTEQDYHALAARRGFVWIAVEVARTTDRSAWICDKGHAFQGAYASILQGHGCPVCQKIAHVERRRYTAQHYHELASSRGFKWRGDKAVSTQNKTTWQCQKEHIWDAPYSSVKGGTGCPICAGTYQRGESEYLDLAKRNRLEFVGEVPLTTTGLTLWKCQTGHTFRMSYSKIRAGYSCQHCSRNLHKTENDYHNLAKSRNFRWLGTYLPSTLIKTQWQCPNGHTWYSTYANISTGYGCPACAGSMRKTADDYIELADQRGFIWLGGVVTNTATPMAWQCSRGHTWISSYSNIKAKHGCPKCINMVNGAKVSMQQLALHAILGGEVNKRIGRYAIDIALLLHGVQIAIEYDCWYWHNKRKEADARRDAYLIGHNWRVLRIKSGNLLPEQDQLDTAIGCLLAKSSYAEIMLDDWQA